MQRVFCAFIVLLSGCTGGIGDAEEPSGLRFVDGCPRGLPESMRCGIEDGVLTVSGSRVGNGDRGLEFSWPGDLVLRDLSVGGFTTGIFVWMNTYAETRIVVENVTLQGVAGTTYPAPFQATGLDLEYSVQGGHGGHAPALSIRNVTVADFQRGIYVQNATTLDMVDVHATGGETCVELRNLGQGNTKRLMASGCMETGLYLDEYVHITVMDSAFVGNGVGLDTIELGGPRGQHLTVQTTTFHGNGLGMATGTGTALIQNSTFSENGPSPGGHQGLSGGIVVRSLGFLPGTPFVVTVSIENSAFTGNQPLAIDDHYPYGRVEAPDNWWGHELGPTLRLTGGVSTVGEGDTIDATVEFVPFLTTAP